MREEDEGGGGRMRKDKEEGKGDLTSYYSEC